ncbi:hypothetical protein S40285_05875 [Stachybotrys chlorohalonatus IBT 40285]|uniref:VOC domain-containing protein n=1 Tax=Stachybotrys chlorohalonatus (strain IBT 40285) TaxID=1283841 RepID=A0A084QBJ6_STAC4|nr:hypothetical protein S40285_05875 [Stachybotrys chlorohalonata IBT 40285]
MVVPFIEVSHLAASSSFYSAVLQPLGLSYIDPSFVPTAVDHGPHPYPSSSVAYGYARTPSSPLLYLRQAPGPQEPLRLSTLVLTAPSRAAVVGFHACALRANPPLQSNSQEGPWLGTDGGVSRAVAHDIDGNKMEVVYPDPRSPHDAVQYTGSSVRTTQSTREEAGRILDWNFDVASARPQPRMPLADRYSSYAHPYSSSLHNRPDPDFYNLSLDDPSADTSQHPVYMPSGRSNQPTYPLRRSFTHHESSARSYEATPTSKPPAMPYQPHNTSAPSPRQSSTTSNLNTTTVVGALLGVAAGAAVTYGLVSRDRDRKPRHDVDAAPILPRRATFPERIEPDRRSIRGEDRKFELDRRSVHVEDRKYPYDSYPPINTNVYYADVVDDYAGAWSSPRYITQGSQHSTRTVLKPGPRSYKTVDDYDTRSRYSTRQAAERAPSVRARSETPVERIPYALPDVDQRSQARSRHSGAPRSSHTRSQSRSRSHTSYDDETYVSARTHRSSATPRPPLTRPPMGYEQELLPEEVVMRSRAGSRATATRVPVSGRQLYPEEIPSKTRSRVSARHVPLPGSGVGSSHANWDDDLESVAPDDSISCVGSKTSRRSRRHYRD